MLYIMGKLIQTYDGGLVSQFIFRDFVNDVGRFPAFRLSTIRASTQVSYGLNQCLQNGPPLIRTFFYGHRIPPKFYPRTYLTVTPH